MRLRAADLEDLSPEAAPNLGLDPPRSRDAAPIPALEDRPVQISARSGLGLPDRVFGGRDPVGCHRAREAGVIEPQQRVAAADEAPVDVQPAYSTRRSIRRAPEPPSAARWEGGSEPSMTGGCIPFSAHRMLMWPWKQFTHPAKVL